MQAPSATKPDQLPIQKKLELQTAWASGGAPAQGSVLRTIHQSQPAPAMARTKASPRARFSTSLNMHSLRPNT